MNIELENVEKTYEGKKVLDIKNLFIPSGKITGIIGPNGSGKSTMLKIISGLINADKGKILYNNNIITKKTMKSMTYLSHNSYLFNDTVYNNISYPLKIRKYPKDKIEKITNGLIEMLGLSEFSQINALLLSGGESQKVTIGRALSFHPDFLILDEPTTNIDPEFIRQIESSIISNHLENNTTVLVVTHNISQALRICSDIIFIKSGRIIFNDSVDNLMLSEDKYIKNYIKIN